MPFAHGGSAVFLIAMAAMFALRMFSSNRRRSGGRGRRVPGGQEAYFSAPQGVRDASSPPAVIGHSGIPAGWMVAPSGRFDQRYWSGTEWTEHVTRDGEPGTDPPPGSGPS